VTPLRAWAYRVEACERTAFYRCYFKRKTAGRTQCCYPVPDEATATAIVAADPDDATCKDFSEPPE
jgi:hypothetical protein